MPHSWSRLAAEPRILAVTLVFLWFAILGVFYLNPEIDLAISRYFFDGVLCGNEPTTVSCGQFDLSQSVIAKAARSVFYQLPVIGGAIVFGVLVVLLVRRRRWDDKEPQRGSPFLIIWAILARLAAGEQAVALSIPRGWSTGSPNYRPHVPVVSVRSSPVLQRKRTSQEPRRRTSPVEQAFSYA